MLLAMRLYGSTVMVSAVALLATSSSPSFAQKAKPKPTPPKTAPASKPLPRLPSVQWPFPKPGDANIEVGFVSKKTGMMQGDSVYIEPVLMKPDKTILYQFGCGLMVGGAFNRDLQPEQVPIGGGIKDGKVFLTVSEEFARAVKVQVSNHKGVNPFVDVAKPPAFDFTKKPTVYGVAITLEPKPFPLAYDISTFANTLLASDNSDVFEYGMAYLSCCNFADGSFAIDRNELQEAIGNTPFQSDQNDPSIFRQSAVRRGTALVNLLNRSMQRWAAKQNHLYNVLAPKDDLVPSTSRSRVFARLLLPVQELQLAKDYENNAPRMAGPAKLVLRMTSNRVLLDRILVSGWAADAIMQGQPMMGQEPRDFRNIELSKWGVRLGNEYGMLAVGTVEMKRRMSFFAVSVSPTSVAHQRMEKLELPAQP